jgi:integrase
MFRRARYQRGSLQRVKRKSGPAVWMFRWYEIQTDGTKKYRKALLGTIEEFRTETEAQTAADALRININRETPRVCSQKMIFGDLVEHYLLNELPEDAGKAKVPKAHSTALTYRRYLKKWILPRWKPYSIGSIEPIAVEDWLFGLGKANGTKAKIRNIMSAVFRHGIRYGFLPRDKEANPMSYVRQTAESDAVHTVLTVEQVVRILSHLREPCRTMAFLDASTGLRVSELLGLKWEDIDFQKQQIHIRRSVVYGVAGQCKTKASRKPVPLDPLLGDLLWQWKLNSTFNRDENWVFASPKTGGRRPYWPGMLIRWHLRPAAKAAGIKDRIGWHTFRRTVATLLVENGENIKVVQELIRHANSNVTLDFYAQAMTPAKREAQGRIVRMLTSAEEKRPEQGSRRVIEPFQTLVEGTHAV